MWNDGDVCRGCLNNLKESESEIGVSIDLYNYCTSVLVESDDENNLVILCQTCHDLLHKFYFFKQRCLRSDSILKERRPRQVEENSKVQNISINYDTIDFISHENVDVPPESVPETNHSDKNKEDITDESSKVKKRKKISKGSMLFCQKCDKTFFKYLKLEAHMRQHFGMKPDPIISCTQCDKKFTTEKNLKSHMRVHTGERKYKCKICDKSFAYLNTLKDHERVHAGIKKYVCQECGKKFVQLTNLKTHILQHTGEKPYSCEVCDRRFRQASEYKLHLLRHSGEKKYTCDICQHSFYTNSILKKHLTTHSDTRPYECKICNKQFKNRSYLLVHNRNHTGERPIACDFCPMKFISGSYKRKHMKKIHNISEERASPKTKQSYETTELTDNCQQSETQIINMELNNTSNIFILNPAQNSKDDCFSYTLQENKEVEIPKNNNEAFMIDTRNKMHCSFDDQNIF